jgi:transcriptional regulator with XRE-family HTH domain
MDMDKALQNTYNYFDKKKFAKEIILKRLMDERFSIRELSRQIGIHFATLSRYERQEITPSIDHLLTICKWLEKPIDFFIGRIELFCPKCNAKMYDEFSRSWHDSENCDKSKKAFNFSTECA